MSLLNYFLFVVFLTTLILLGMKHLTPNFFYINFNPQKFDWYGIILHIFPIFY
jgi:hypothetical protein